MKMRTVFPVVGLFLLLMFVPVHAQRTTGVTGEEFLGVLSKGNYVNKYFGFSLEFPQDYPTMSSDQTAFYAKAGGDLLKGDNTSTSKKIDAALVTQAHLMAVSMKAIGQPENAILEIAVQKQQPRVTARMALAASVTLATGGGKMRLVRSIDSRFGKKPFVGAELEGEFAIKLSQEMYATMINGYAVVFVITYGTPEGRANMISIMNSLKFTK